MGEGFGGVLEGSGDAVVILKYEYIEVRGLDFNNNKFLVIRF